MPGTERNGESGEGMSYSVWRQTVTSSLPSTHLTCSPGLCWRWTEGCSPTQLGRETGMLLGTAGWTGETVYSLTSGTSQTIRGIWLLAAAGYEVLKKSI